MPQDSRRRAGITTLLNCQKSKATRFFGQTSGASGELGCGNEGLSAATFLPVLYPSSLSEASSPGSRQSGYMQLLAHVSALALRLQH